MLQFKILKFTSYVSNYRTNTKIKFLAEILTQINYPSINYEIYIILLSRVTFLSKFLTSVPLL